MAAVVGLAFDLSSWRKGVKQAGRVVESGLGNKQMRNFDRGIGGSIRRMRVGFAAAGTAIKGAMMAALMPLIKIVAPLLTIAAIVKTISGSVKSFRANADAAERLRRALEASGTVNMDGAIQGVDELGMRLTRTMGILRRDTADSVAQFINRGFDEAGARKLTILAANVAKATGKSMEEASKIVADVARGNSAALRQVGMDVEVTGDKAVDAQAGLAKLADIWGDAGTDIANNGERMTAIWSDLSSMLGEVFGPIAEEMLAWVGNFIQGLTLAGENGGSAFEKIGGAIKFAWEFLKNATVQALNLFDVLKNGGSTVLNFINFVVSKALEIILGAISKLPGSKRLMKAIGLDIEEIANVAGEFADISIDNASQAGSRMLDAGRALTEASAGESAQFITGIAKAGESARAEARRELAEELAGVQDVRSSFSRERQQAQREDEARQAQDRADRDRQREEERRTTAQERIAQQQLSGRADARGGVSVRISTIGDDRFRRGRLR